jgi:hypothetical protein
MLGLVWTFLSFMENPNLLFQLYYNFVLNLTVSYVQMILGDLCHLLLVVSILLQLLLKMHPHENGTPLTNLETP